MKQDKNLSYALLISADIIAILADSDFFRFSKTAIESYNASGYMIIRIFSIIIIGILLAVFDAWKSDTELLKLGLLLIINIAIIILSATSVIFLQDFVRISFVTSFVAGKILVTAINKQA